ncbi:universal stress protein [Rhizomonospora bruguierae]|uniref:universal stress protein n=1 Tax=Rhizomonospora bruguierae TaxID=1581705 RepID=UPI001BCE8310|nr:universal stress protein [Micromonospora sp. NBRC 107566]
MNPTDDRPIVVGTDDSAGAHRAVDWALDEAALLVAPVRLTRALEWPGVANPLVPIAAGWPDGEVRRGAQRSLDAAVVSAGARRPDVEVTGELCPGQAAEVLRDRSAEARMLVLGDGGHGGVRDFLLGSTTTAVASHAASPVVVVRGEDRQAPVVAGVDGSDGSMLALDFALSQADAAGVKLRVVTAWAPPPGDGVPPPLTDPDRLTESVRKALHERLAGPRARYPDVEVEESFVYDRPVNAMLDAAERARLVVVGSRGHGGFAGLLLGSVSRALMNHASCPVAVVRGT